MSAKVSFRRTRLTFVNALDLFTNRVEGLITSESYKLVTANLFIFLIRLIPKLRSKYTLFVT